MNSLAELVAKVAELERRMSGMVRHGTVHSVDPAKQTVRMVIGEGDDGPVLSPPIPYGQQAGALKVHTPPTVGQQMTAFAPSGDPQQAVAMPFTWSNQNQSPSQAGDQNVITFAGMRIELTAGGLKITKGGMTTELTGSGVKVTAGGVTHDISGSGIKTTGGKIEHNDLNIGSDHKHRDVEPGAGVTGIPTA